MCGIVYIRDLEGKKVNKQIRTAYFHQKNRGTEGYGFVDISDSVHLVRTQYEHEIMRELKNNPSSDIMFHHRIPTSTPNRVISNHPIPTDDNELYSCKYYMIHNGIIWNSDALKYRHEDMGLRYVTQQDNKYNDSESLLHELALYIEGYNDKIDCHGSIAFVMLQTDKHGKPLNLFFGRNDGNPLRMVYTKDKILKVASEGEGQYVETDKLYKYNYTTNELTTTNLTIGGEKYTSYAGIDDDLTSTYGLPIADEELDEMTDEEIENVYHQACEYRQSILVDYQNEIRDGNTDAETEEYKEELNMELEGMDKLIQKIEYKYPHLQLQYII